MKLTKLRDSVLCIPHLNGMEPRGRYIGCSACEKLIETERPKSAEKVVQVDLRKRMSTAEKLKRLRGGKRPKLPRRGPSEPRLKAPPLKFGIGASIELKYPEKLYELVWATVD